MSDYSPQAVLDFWFGPGADYGKRHKRWFEKDASFDADVTRLFRALYDDLSGKPRWLDPANDCLARILVLDQFPRHMFRGTARAFATDAQALATARHALTENYDRTLLPVERLFVYLPFEHSEALEDQILACDLTAPLGAFPETFDAHRFALAHREIIERFGRFPHRNAALGRASTPEELAFLQQPGSSF